MRLIALLCLRGFSPNLTGLAFAGVMSSWTPSEGEAAMLTCSILTRAVEGPAADVHDRMPVILPDEVQSAWIDPKQTDSEKALALAREKAVTAVEHFRVSPRVNNAKNQSAELIEPFENPAWLVTIIRSADCLISRLVGHLTQDSLPLSVATH